MSTPRVHLLGALAVMLAVAGSAAAESGAAPGRAPASSEIFGFPLVVPCGFSHRNHDDPIVYPKQPGRSHDHTFFGNRSTNAFSTPASLRAGRRTTCGLSADTAAYWAPTLFVDRRAVLPAVLVATYSRRTSAPVDPFPAGLKMVGGDAHARTAQSGEVAFWSCAFAPGGRWSTIPTCSGIRRGLQLNVNFPNCWDGKRLDSPNHKSHMAYSSGGACPGSHPVEVPSLSLLITYPVAGGPKAELSSGRFGAHADFLNAWDQGTFAGLVDRYFNGKA
jgi:Domain of unknown function (DUF1996)